MLKLQFQLLDELALRLVLVDLETLGLVSIRFQIVLVTTLRRAVKR